MKKLLLVFIMFIASVNLSSCQTKNYDALYDDYENYLVEQHDNYENYIAILDSLSANTLKGVVLVEAIFSAQLVQNQGTGVVIDEDEMYYYILTNHHVVTYQDNQASSYYVKNYLNETVEATFMFSDINYDLGLLKIAKTNDLYVYAFNYDTYEIGDMFASVGYPSGQNHAITLGFFIDYEKITTSDITSPVNYINFDVIVSDVPVKSGSSGSAMINLNQELIGLVYAARFSSGSTISTHAYTIPSFKIIEFLDVHEYGGLSI